MPVREHLQREIARVEGIRERTDARAHGKYLDALLRHARAAAAGGCGMQHRQALRSLQAVEG